MWEDSWNPTSPSSTVISSTAPSRTRKKVASLKTLHLIGRNALKTSLLWIYCVFYQILQDQIQHTAIYDIRYGIMYGMQRYYTLYCLWPAICNMWYTVISIYHTKYSVQNIQLPIWYIMDCVWHMFFMVNTEWVLYCFDVRICGVTCWLQNRAALINRALKLRGPEY